MSGLKIIDASDPSAPVLLGSYDRPSLSVTGVDVINTTAYIVSSELGLEIIDVSDPSTPNFQGSFGTRHSIYKLTVEDSAAYVANFNFGLQIIDVSDCSGTCSADLNNDGSLDF